MVGWRKKKDSIPRRRLRTDDTTSEQRQVTDRPNGTVFRRNRTLVGSLSASVSSANELGGDLRSPRAHVHHLTAHRRRLGTILIAVLAGAGFLTWFLYNFTATIRVSANTEGSAIQSGRYESAINDYFAGRPGERLRVFLNETQLNSYLSNTLPEVESVRVEGASGIATSQFAITFRKPIASWLIGSTQYYVDKNGISFKTNYFDRPKVKVSDQSGVPQTGGTTVASSRFLRFVGHTVELSAQSGLVVEEAIIPPNTTRQIEVKLAGYKYPIKLSLDRPVGEQVEDMKHAVQFFKKRKITPEYVDVRISGKAFYK